MQQTFALHKIDDIEKISFDPAEYSKFKFGDGKIAEQYGVDLAKAFIETTLSKLKIEQQIVVLSSPYTFIPTATFGLKNHFIYTLNLWLCDNNYPVAQEAKIHRIKSYKEDYGALNAAERLALIGDDQFYVDAEFVKNKLLIFIDDIKITGTHEKMIRSMLEIKNIESDSFLIYFAELTNQNIHPNIENYLNYYHVKTIFDLDELIADNTFLINTRIVKFILNNDEKTFLRFITNKTMSFLKSLYNMAIGNSYHTIDAYQNNLKIIKNRIDNN
jgi:hypothetical protein